jgi:hypothetical protein
MSKRISNVATVFVLGGVIAYGALNNLACSDDDDDINITTGTGGTGGSSSGRGGSGGGGGGIVDNTITYTLSLTAAAEVPPNDSDATGNVTVTLHTGTGAVSVTGTFDSLSSDGLSAHIHGPAGPTENAPIILPLTIDPDRNGDVSGSGVLSSAMVTAMQNGQTYINIHSNDFPDGEIRAQITQ